VKIVVLAVGKLRDRHFAALCDDYIARARRHLTVDVIEVEDDAALARKWPAQGETIALDVGGDAWSTDRLARHVGDRMLHGGRALTFAIGGADGLPPALLGRAAVRLSLSAMTLPHRMARLVLLEQIYRALTIIRGEPYHH
jgi:23S rRNA (pseudouridine1915-N3)-methyltransferase